jgi:hypothetical protein
MITCIVMLGMGKSLWQVKTQEPEKGRPCSSRLGVEHDANLISENKMLWHIS